MPKKESSARVAKKMASPASAVSQILRSEAPCFTFVGLRTVRGLMVLLSVSLLGEALFGAKV